MCEMGFYENLNIHVSANVNKNSGLETDASDLEQHDVSFLKRAKLLIDGDVESDPGPTDNIENTPTRGKGRPKGTPKKTKGFRGTPKKILTNSSIRDVANINGPIGLVNIANDCFFNSVVQALLDLRLSPGPIESLPLVVSW